jgi:hypothetical protein
VNQDNIYAMFLRIITEYEYLDFSEDELMEEFMEILSMAVPEVQLQGICEDLECDTDFGLSRDVDVQSAYILAHACVLIWVLPKVNSSEMLAYALTSTDFTLFSPANRLQACMKLQAEVQAKLNHLINDYHSRSVISEMKKQVDGN